MSDEGSGTETMMNVKSKSSKDAPKSGVEGQLTRGNGDIATTEKVNSPDDLKDQACCDNGTLTASADEEDQIQSGKGDNVSTGTVNFSAEVEEQVCSDKGDIVISETATTPESEPSLSDDNEKLCLHISTAQEQGRAIHAADLMTLSTGTCEESVARPIKATVNKKEAEIIESSPNLNIDSQDGHADSVPVTEVLGVQDEITRIKRVNGVVTSMETINMLLPNKKNLCP